jgi:hypothetical protein
MGTMTGMEQTFTDRLRQAVRESGVSRYVIWKQTGIDQATLSKFVHGQAGMSLDAINRLMTFLELEIRPRRRKRKES